MSEQKQCPHDFILAKVNVLTPNKCRKFRWKQRETPFTCIRYASWKAINTEVTNGVQVGKQKWGMLIFIM